MQSVSIYKKPTQLERALNRNDKSLFILIEIPNKAKFIVVKVTNR